MRREWRMEKIRCRGRRRMTTGKRGAKQAKVETWQVKRRRRGNTQWRPNESGKGEEESDKLIWWDEKRPKVKERQRETFWRHLTVLIVTGRHAKRGQKRHANYARKGFVSQQQEKEGHKQTQSRSPKWCKGQVNEFKNMIKESEILPKIRWWRRSNWKRDTCKQKKKTEVTIESNWWTHTHRQSRS